jgi:hypothetical protein
VLSEALALIETVPETSPEAGLTMAMTGGTVSVPPPGPGACVLMESPLQPARMAANTIAAHTPVAGILCSTSGRCFAIACDSRYIIERPKLAIILDKG